VSEQNGKDRDDWPPDAAYSPECGTGEHAECCDVSCECGCHDAERVEPATRLPERSEWRR